MKSKEYKDIKNIVKEKENNLRQKINSLCDNVPKGYSVLDDIAKSLYKSYDNSPIYIYYGLKAVKDIIEDFEYRNGNENEYIKYSKLNYYILFNEQIINCIAYSKIQNKLKKVFAKTYFSKFTSEDDVKTFEKVWSSLRKVVGNNEIGRKFISYINQNIWLAIEFQDIFSLRNKVIASYFLIAKNEYYEYMKAWKEKEN